MQFKFVKFISVIIFSFWVLIYSANAQNQETNNSTNGQSLTSRQKLDALLYKIIKNQGTNNATDRQPLTSRQQLEALDYTTVPYKKEALRLLIREANDVARELNLPERLPITQADLTYVIIGTPRMAAITSCIGTIDTSNYEYSVAIGQKLCFITSQKLDSDEARDKLKAKYLWPIERRDTNAAYQLATQWLAAAHMDVKKIEHDCKVHIWSWTPDGVDERHFVPLYFLTWKKSKPEKSEPDWPVASVELLEPTHLLGKLNVHQSEYILRKPVEVTNLETLLSPTNISETETGPPKPAR